MPKHGQKIAPEGVDKEHICGLYVNNPGKLLCTYCCSYCEQKSTCINACKNTPDKCGKIEVRRAVTTSGVRYCEQVATCIKTCKK